MRRCLGRLLHIQKPLGLDDFLVLLPSDVDVVCISLLLKLLPHNIMIGSAIPRSSILDEALSPRLSMNVMSNGVSKVEKSILSYMIHSYSHYLLKD